MSRAVLNSLRHKVFSTCISRSYTDFTKNQYKVVRGNYGSVEEIHLRFFRKLLGEERIVTNLSDLEKYNVDFFKHMRGSSHIVLKPKTTDEVSKILAFCNSNRLAVCTQGGHTGVVGGGTPVFDEIVLSTELMNEIIKLDEISGTLICQAGCILQNLDQFLAEKNLIFPLDLGAKGSCQIGGNVSTNAGGLRLLKFGNLHGNVLGLEVVQANGAILDCLTTLKKDNTGYHLKNLFIGAEGTLGVVTKVAIQCLPRPKSTNLAFLGLQSYSKVRETLGKAKQDLNEILSAFEVMDSSSLDVINLHMGLKSPIGEYPYYVMIETMGSDPDHDVSKVQKFLENCLTGNYILNGISTNEPAKIGTLWAIREKIPEALLKDGYTFLYDFTLPLEYYYRIVGIMKDHMGKLSHRVYGFGHLGDGNLHLHIAVKQFSIELQKHIEPFIFEKVKELGGSISAEHGMGFMKAKYMPLMKSESAVRIMKNIKRNMDPNGILNPYKMLP